MSQTVAEEAKALWDRLVETHCAILSASQAFCAAMVSRVPLLGKALRTPGMERSTALRILPYLSQSERLELFPDLMHAARSAHGPVQAVWDALLALPRDWVLAHVEAEVDAILRDEEEDDYWMFLQLYHQLDADLLQRLARRAAAHTSPAIRELGEDYLPEQSQTNGTNSSENAPQALSQSAASE
jgi:hypothetical protein